MVYEYKTKGTCSSQIEVVLDGTIIQSISFVGGCNGNLKGISRLVVGMEAQDAIDRLSGTVCGGKITSCPDQMSIALKHALKLQEKAS